MNRMPPPLPDSPRKPRYGQRMHGIMVAEYTTKNFWLLLFPLIRGLLALQFDLFSWVRGAWFDLLIVGALLGMAVLRWYSTSYEIHPTGILIRRGVLADTRLFLPLSKLASASLEASFPYRMIGAVRIRLETDAGSRRRSDFRATVSVPKARELLDALQHGDVSVAGSTSFHYQPVWLHLLLFSILSSDSLSGVLISSTFLSLTGAFVGRSLSDEVLATISEFAAGIAVNIPPIAVMLSIILLGGWLFSFVRNVLRYLRFHLWRDAKTSNIRIETGFFARRVYQLNLRHIHVLDMRQTLLTKLLRVASVYVSCAGYGKAKEERAILVPATGKKNVLSVLRNLLPEWMPADRKSSENVRPPAASFLAYTGTALAFSLGIPAAAMLLTHFFSLLYSFILWTAILAEIPALWALALGCTNFGSAGVALHSDRLTLRYARGLTLHTVVVPLHKISQLTVRQSLFQRPSKCCDILLYALAEGTSRHRVRGLTLDQAHALRDKLLRK